MQWRFQWFLQILVEKSRNWSWEISELTWVWGDIERHGTDGIQWKTEDQGGKRLKLLHTLIPKARESGRWEPRDGDSTVKVAGDKAAEGARVQQAVDHWKEYCWEAEMSWLRPKYLQGMLVTFQERSPGCSGDRRQPTEDWRENPAKNLELLHCTSRNLPVLSSSVN